MVNRSLIPSCIQRHSCPDGLGRSIPQLLLPSLLQIAPPPISLLHSARSTMHQYCVLLTMCCSLTANESQLVRGTTQNSTSREPPITYSCLRCKATITKHRCKSSASTAGLLIDKYKDLDQYLNTTACFCRLLCSMLVFTKLEPHAAPVHTPFHQLHSCQTVINESNRGARQPRSPSCLGRTGDG